MSASAFSLYNEQISARLGEAETDRRLRVLRPDAPRRLAERAWCGVPSIHVSDAQVRRRPASTAFPQ